MTLIMSEHSQLDADAAERYLQDLVLPLRLAVNDSEGCPLVASHWFLYRSGQLLSVVHKHSLILKRLQSDPRCGFEVANEQPPYRGVRGQADVAVLSDGAGELLKTLFQRYSIAEGSQLGQWLLGRADDERILQLTPRWVSAWDYSQRMADARGR